MSRQTKPLQEVIQALDRCGKLLCGKECPYHGQDMCMLTMTQDAIALLRDQEGIIAQYKTADAFLAAHGWKWGE